MTENSGKIPLIKFFTILIFAAAVSACSSTKDLVLDDPAFRNEMINAALEGESFKIREEDYPEIKKLIHDNNPDYRLAGVILAGQADTPVLYKDIILAYSDKNKKVSDKAFEIIKKNKKDFLPCIINMLSERSANARNTAAALLGDLGEDSVISNLIEHFNDPDPNVRNQASISVYKLTDRNNIELRKALESPDPEISAIAIRTLGRYKNPDDMDLYIQNFSSSSDEIRAEAQLAALRTGTAGLEKLHKCAADSNCGYKKRISALDVIQGLRSVKSISVLISLLNDPDSRISKKSEYILGTYGKEAVGALSSLYKNSDLSQNRIYAVVLLGRIGDESALSVLGEALDDPSPEVRNAAGSAITGFEEECLPALHNVLLNGGKYGKNFALNYLRAQYDIWLIKKEDGKPNFKALKLLIIQSEKKQLENYLKNIDIPRTCSESILDLKDAWIAAEEFAEFEKEIANGEDKFLYAWRQWEIYSVAARETLKESFDKLHEYIETKNLKALEQSRIIREQGRKLSEKADEQLAIIHKMNRNEIEEGKIRLEKFRSERDFLVRVWEYTIPELKELAEELYVERGLNPDSLSRESSLPAVLPEK